MCLVETDEFEVEDAICSGELVDNEDGNKKCSDELTCPKDYTLSNGKCIKSTFEK